jgi:hypothetical protein
MIAGCGRVAPGARQPGASAGRKRRVAGGAW